MSTALGGVYFEGAAPSSPALVAALSELPLDMQPASAAGTTLHTPTTTQPHQQQQQTNHQQEEKQATGSNASAVSSSPMMTPVRTPLGKRSSSSSIGLKSPLGGGSLGTPSRSTRASPNSGSVAAPTPLSPSVLNWEFPDGSSPSPVPTKHRGGSGVFKSYFSPNAQTAASAYTVQAAAQSDYNAAQPIVAAPLAEFGSSPVPRKKKAASGANSPTRPRSSGGMGLGHSASAAIMHTSTSALGIAHSSPANDSTTSFARRMIHAQSAAELLQRSPPQASHMSGDPNATSLFFAARAGGEGAEELAMGFQERVLAAASSPTRDANSTSVALVPYGSANPTGVYPNYSTRASSYGARPQTAGVSSSGVAWSGSFTGNLAEPLPRQSHVKRPTTSSSRLATPPLPPELTVGVEGMSPHMQREHAALARLIQGLEPAGRASLGGAGPQAGGVFAKLGNASRQALFAKPTYYEASQSTRLEQSSQSEEFLRKRSVQKSVELRAAATAKTASGLHGASFSPLDVARAVERTSEEYPISSARPRPVRPPTCASEVATASAVSAAGSSSAAGMVERLTLAGRSDTPKNKSRPTTSSGGRPTSSHESPAPDAPQLLLPGFALSGTQQSNPQAVLGFGGSIDRFGDRVSELRHTNTSTSHLGGRGMLAAPSASKILAGTIVTTGASANEPPHSAKRFASLALEFEVALAERLARIGSTGNGARPNSGKNKSAASSASLALERLDVFRTALDSVILHSPHFGGLLTRIKGEYEAYARRGALPDGASGAEHDAASLAARNQQQLEDTLVLENHRLQTKLHGFQRAYASLYAKYKNRLHTTKVQEGIMHQNALVLQDLNEQLQQSVLASMSDEERTMESLRKAGFKLANATHDEALVAAAEQRLRDASAQLPDLDHDEAEELLELAEAAAGSEAARRTLHERKVARAREQQAAKVARENDPLERGRQLMRAFQRSPADAASNQVQLAYDDDENLVDPSDGEVVLDAVKLVRFFDEDDDAAPLNEDTAARLARTSPDDPRAMLEALEDPLASWSSARSSEAAVWRQKQQEMEEAMLRLQTQVDQARAGEMAALMSLEAVAKQRHATAQQQQQPPAETPKKPSRSPIDSRRSSSASLASATPATMHQAPAHALLDNIGPEHTQAHGRAPSLPLTALELGHLRDQPDDNEDEDPDNELAPEHNAPDEDEQASARDPNRRASLISQASSNARDF